MVWGKLMPNKEKKDITPEELYPSKITMMDYQREMEEKVTEYLKDLTNDDLQTKDGFMWFNSIFEKLTYLLRHNAHHLGELGRMLRAWDAERMKWQ